MYSATIISSVAALVVSVLVLLAFQINKDRSESTKWVKRAVWINFIGLLFILLTYSLCAYDYAMRGPEVLENADSMFWTSFAFRDLADLFFVPVCMCFAHFTYSLTRKGPEITKRLETVVRLMIVIGVLIAVLVVGYIIARMMGFYDYGIDTLIYNIEFGLVALALVLVAFVIYAARKELGGVKIACLVFYILLNLFSLVIVWYTEECLFFALDVSALLFLFIAMQSEQVDMSKVESVRSALAQAEQLNDALQDSMKALERESSLLRDISGIYESLHLISLKQNTYRELSVPPQKAQDVIDDMGTDDPQVTLWAIMKKVCDPAYYDELHEFTALSTVNERLKGKKTIICEVIDDDNQWFRFSFIRLGDDLNEDMSEVVFVSQNIDAQRREIERLTQISYHDNLTGAFNRNAFIARCKAYTAAELPERLWVVVVDINGLKEANDSKGHDAGDEMIIATAGCLLEAVGIAGRVYRKGGDEFVAVVHGSRDEFAEIYLKLMLLKDAWHGRYIDELMFSIGYVCSDDHPGMNMDELVATADKLMYADKKSFYESHEELDRRRR